MSDISELLAKVPCSPEYDSFLAELDAAGYAIVPTEMTRDMRDAWNSARYAEYKEAPGCYRAMLAAAPKVAE